jgi:hypothetical protein
MQKSDTQTYEIGFSYNVEIDGEPCDYSGEIVTDFTTEHVKGCEKDKTGEEWEQTLSYFVCEEGNRFIPHEEISNLTWEYSRKIDRRTQEYRSVA